MKKKIKKYINIEKKVGKCPRIFSSYKMMVFEIYGCRLYFRIFFRSYNVETVNIFIILKGMVTMAEINMIKIITDGMFNNEQELETMFNVGVRMGIKEELKTVNGIDVEDHDTKVSVTEDGKIKIKTTVEMIVEPSKLK